MIGWIESLDVWMMVVEISFISCLEDHPRTCKWLITMVSFCPLSRVVGPLPNGLNGL